MGVDRILDLIDAGLQSSPEVGMELAEPGWCTRCTRLPVADDSEFCPTCRAYLLGDIDEPRSELTDMLDQIMEGVVRRTNQLAMDALLYGNAYTDLTTGERVDPVTVVHRNDGGWQPVGEDGEPVRWVAGLPVVLDESMPPDRIEFRSPIEAAQREVLRLQAERMLADQIAERNRQPFLDITALS